MDEWNELIKKGWFELTSNFCPRFGAKVERLGRTVFTVENMRVIEDILKDVKDHEKDTDRLETIKYIWWGIRRLTGDFPNGSKK